MPTPKQGSGPQPTAAVSTVGLRKSYGDKTVLDGIDLRIPAGSVFALLGPNGAGKTTTVQILSTLIAADGGQAQVVGHDVTTSPDGVRAAIGVTGQFAALDDLLTAEENLLLMADLLRLGKQEGRARVGELLQRFGIADVAHKRAATFSGGMRRRLDLAMTLVGEPQVIFLDEPTTGLDPRSRRTMWDTVRSLVAGGTTVFLTTENLALRVAGDSGLDALRALLDRLDATGVRAADFSVHTPDLDDVFLALTGEGTTGTGTDTGTPTPVKETSR
jgi:ABC-2 type transport system ATP-binding protein